jgi:hypothetical protein
VSVVRSTITGCPSCSWALQTRIATTAGTRNSPAMIAGWGQDSTRVRDGSEAESMCEPHLALLMESDNRGLRPRVDVSQAHSPLGKLAA